MSAVTRMRAPFATVIALALACSVACGPGATPSPTPGASGTAASSSATSATPSPSPASSAAPTATASPATTASPPPTPTPAPTVDTSMPQVRLVRAMGALGFNDATGAVQAADGRWYVLEQAGRVMTFKEGDAAATVFLDIRDRITSGGETGLLGIALSPSFDQNGVFFLNYTAPSPLRTRIASYTSDRLVASKASEAIALEFAQPYANHNGGQLAFGPDGYLYVGVGDGGSGGDPQRNGQNPNAILGKILRIDVRDRTRAAIPPDNPYANGGGRPEIYAIGFRNPWRFSFDGATLYVADVGQNQYEEIDVVARGGNYGWNVMEGFHCYGASSCNRTGLALPIAEYDHSEGCSVTGGYVHRGTPADLAGIYYFADYCSGRVWGVRFTGGRTVAIAQVATTGFAVGSFAQDRAGNVYILQYAGSGGFYRITR